MNKFTNIILTGILTLGLSLGLQANCAEIVYPKSDNVVINSPETFFIGNETGAKDLKINGEQVDIHPSGGFYHVVKLNFGENIFKIDNGKTVQTYTITRKNSTSIPAKDVTAMFETPLVVVTKSDNVPLRSMPNDSGMNRLQHLQKGIPLLVVGEYGDFYKVQLSRDDFVWISKNYTDKADLKEINNASIVSYNYTEEKDRRIFELKLSRKVPYVLSESSGLDLTVYNVKDFPYNKYEFHINKTGKSFGYKSYYTEDNTLRIEVKNPPVVNSNKPLDGIRIAIDAGHGGNEAGATGCLGNKEKDINLEISIKLKEKLEKAGARVIMTRTDDSDTGLNDRVKFSNDNNAQIFVSIHNNALPDSLAHLKSTGSEIYYFYPQSKPLAQSILKSLTTETGLKDNGVKAQSFAVIRNTNCPAVLVEIGYIINPDDNAKLVNPEFQEKTAEAIVHGLENYLK